MQNLPTHHSRELANLFGALSLLPPAVHEEVMRNHLPFALEVARARSGGDGLKVVQSLTTLLRRCKMRAKKGGVEAGIWKERAVRVGIVLSSTLLEMKEPVAAITLLLPLLEVRDNSQSDLIFSLAKIYLSIGNLNAGSAMMRRLEESSAPKEMIGLGKAFEAIAYGDEDKAESAFQSVREESDNKTRALAGNGLACVLLSKGEVDKVSIISNSNQDRKLTYLLTQAVEHLESTIRTSPAINLIESLTFNLATLYELRANTAIAKKVDLLIVAATHTGNGFKVRFFSFYHLYKLGSENVSSIARFSKAPVVPVIQAVLIVPDAVHSLFPPHLYHSMFIIHHLSAVCPQERNTESHST